MSQKFSIVIEVGKDGKPVATAYLKSDASFASAHFVTLRDGGKEAYFFQHPVADRRSKSTEQIAATLGERGVDGRLADTVVLKAPVPNDKLNEIPMPTPKKRKGNSIQGVSTDGGAVDMA